MGDLSRETGLPISFTALQSPIKAMAFEEQLAAMRSENARGANLVAQVSLRGTGLVLGWQATFHPFAYKPSWLAIKDLPWSEQLQHLQDASFRDRLLAEPHQLPDTDLRMLLELMIAAFNMQYPMVEGFNYEPGPIAARRPWPTCPRRPTPTMPCWRVTAGASSIFRC